MSDIICKECGKEVNSTANTCPECGAAPATKTSTRTYIIIAVIALVIAAPFIIVGSNSGRTEEEKNLLLEQVEAENRRSGFNSLNDDPESNDPQ